MNEICAVKERKLSELKKNKKGFTLIELVVVIAILAVLAAVAIPMVSTVINSANKNTAVTNAASVTSALLSAQQQLKSNDETNYSKDAKVEKGQFKFLVSNEKLADALQTKSIGSKTYKPYWSTNLGKVVFCESASSTTTIDGVTISTADTLTELTPSLTTGLLDFEYKPSATEATTVAPTVAP